jgi:hypothetical protein
MILDYLKGTQVTVIKRITADKHVKISVNPHNLCHLCSLNHK